MRQELVTVGSFTYPVGAWLAKLRLDHAGIASYVADENLISTYWLYSNALGGVKLQVARNDVRAAMEVLSEGPASTSDERARLSTDVPDTTCPVCGSTEVVWQKYWRRAVFLCWLVVGFPLPILRQSWFCLSCRAWGRLPLQFTLRTLLIVTLIVAVACSLVRVSQVGWFQGDAYPIEAPQP
jgi:hypothetical protein